VGLSLTCFWVLLWTISLCIFRSSLWICGSTPELTMFWCWGCTPLWNPIFGGY
jgi:hypothetical protein